MSQFKKKNSGQTLRQAKKQKENECGEGKGSEMVNSSSWFDFYSLKCQKLPALTLPGNKVLAILFINNNLKQ